MGTADEHTGGGRSSPLGYIRRHMLWVRLASMVLVFALILRWIDPHELVASLAATDARVLVAVVGLALFDRFLMSYKWSLLMRAHGAAIQSLEAFRIYLISGFLGTFLPTSVSGDVVRTIRTTADGRRGDVVAATVVVERAVGLVAITLLSLSCLAVYSSRSGEVRGLYYTVWAVLGLLILGLALSVQERSFAVIRRILSRFEHVRPVRMYLDFHGAYVALARRWKILLVFGLLSVVEQGVLGFMNYLAAVALGLQVSLIAFLGLVPLSNFILLFPFSVGGYGVEEGVYILLLRYAGLAPTQSLALILLMRVVGWLMLIPGGLALLYESSRLGRVERMRE